jgi:hypothetical protein
MSPGTSEMKPAVFQVYEADGSVRLVCFYMPSLAAAVDLEKTIRHLCGPDMHVNLLGRFQRIQMATSIDEAIAFVLAPQGSNRRETITLLRSVRDGG